MAEAQAEDPRPTHAQHARRHEGDSPASGREQRRTKLEPGGRSTEASQLSTARHTRAARNHHDRKDYELQAATPLGLPQPFPQGHAHEQGRHLSDAAPRAPTPTSTGLVLACQPSDEDKPNQLSATHGVEPSTQRSTLAATDGQARRSTAQGGQRSEPQLRLQVDGRD